METSTIRIAIHKLPEQFDRSRITTVLDEIESALMDDGGVYVRAYADGMTITIEVPTSQLIDAATCLNRHSPSGTPSPQCCDCFSPRSSPLCGFFRVCRVNRTDFRSLWQCFRDFRADRRSPRRTC
jgi:hypothetical protein